MLAITVSMTLVVANDLSSAGVQFWRSMGPAHGAAVATERPHCCARQPGTAP